MFSNIFHKQLSFLIVFIAYINKVIIFTMGSYLVPILTHKSRIFTYGWALPTGNPLVRWL